MEEKKLVPKLRFPGFTEPWEQRKLIDIAKTFIGLVTTMTENYRDSGTLLIRNSDIKEGQFVFSEKPIHLDEEFAEKNKTRRLQIGDVVTVHTGDIGTSAVIQEKEAGSIGFATINTRTDKRILNPYFLSTYFNTEKHKCYANSVSTGDGRSNYNIKDFNKLVISIPSLDEQEKISVLINNINTIITLHQRKLEHLKLKKKSLLQKLFPKEGEVNPELRFPGFTDPWEQRKLGEILVERNQQFPMDCEYPLMAFIANEGVAPKGERYDRSALVTDSENKLYKRTELGDFIYSSNNLETGSIGLNKFGNACISPVYSIFKSTEIGDPKFLGRRLVRKDIINAMIRWRQGVIYGQWRIHESDFLKIIISIPLIEEQREIGMFLTKVDTLITLHQRKLEHLQLLKKALLQQLFV